MEIEVTTICQLKGSPAVDNVPPQNASDFGPGRFCCIIREAPCAPLPGEKASLRGGQKYGMIKNHPPTLTTGGDQNAL